MALDAKVYAPDFQVTVQPFQSQRLKSLLRREFPKFSSSRFVVTALKPFQKSQRLEVVTTAES